MPMEDLLNKVKDLNEQLYVIEIFELYTFKRLKMVDEGLLISTCLGGRDLITPWTARV